MKCPNCGKPIGSEKNVFLRNFFSENDIIIVKRDNYFRIFKDDKEIKKIKKRKNYFKKLIIWQLMNLKKIYV